LIFKNTFVKRNTDVSHHLVPNDQYIAASNVEAVGDGEFFSLQNIRGTTAVQEIINDSLTECIHVMPNLYSIGGTAYKCLTVFTASNTLFKIWCYNTQTDTLYELYQETTSGYLTSDRVIQAETYPENGLDYVYFTDNHNELRFLKCEIPSPYLANFLTSYDISLARRGANGTITLTSISSTGGSLLSGTYQFAYRMCDPENKRFTKWSTLSNPIHVYSASNSNDTITSGIGLSTSRKLNLTITPSYEETENFDYLQLAVVENVGPTIQDIDGVTSALPTTASLLEITPIPSTSLSFAYKSNSRIGTIPIDDIVVDLAQIEKVKTLAIKENRLFGGNVSYANLEFDNGTPSATSGSVISETLFSRDIYSSDESSSNHLGYWRDEVYRFGIVYFDKYGNKSSVQPLDLDGKITGNQITSGVPDLKFPSRSTSNTYSLFDTGTAIRALGLNLTGIINHPTWARGFEIVRVKRKKNILFQTPLIPMTTVQGTGAISFYPTTYYSEADTDVIIDDAQPMTSSKILIPKNLMWPELREIVQNGAVSGSGRSFKTSSEVYLSRKNFYDFAAVFPPSSMYGDTPFVYTGGEKLDIIDYALLKLEYDDFVESEDYNAGDYAKTSVTGTFYALNESQYYFDADWSGKTIASNLKNIPLTDYEFFDNLGQPASVAGNSALDYEALQTKNVSLWQHQPTVQKMGVFQLGQSLFENSRVFKAGTLNAAGDSNYIVGSSGAQYNPTTALSNDYVFEYSGTLNYVSALAIANIKLGLGDERYGDINTTHEYISTGAKYTFTEAEVANVEAGNPVSIDLDVWGGDCFIAPHLFKVCDSTYSVIDQQKNQTPLGSGYDDIYNMAQRWTAVYRYAPIDADPAMCIPVPVPNCGQYLQVILESDYNGGVRDVEAMGSNNSENGMPIYINSTEASVRSPLTYKYNLNLSKQNDRKIFLPKPTYSFQQNDFAARLIYSDLKIYNSDQPGFDIFRVGNIYDLEENRRSITKLAVAGDSLYAIQEQGIVYIPTGERQLEATDSGQLSVRSGEIIGRPSVVDSRRGSIHPRGIISTGGVIFIPDNINKSVYVLAGQELKPIIQDNETLFRSFFGNLIDQNAVVGVYDPLKREYWIYANDQCEVFNEQRGWITTLDFTGLMGGVSTNQKLYLIGKPSTSLSIHEMYTGNVESLFGETVNSSVTCVVNEENHAKVFDNLMITSSTALDTVDLVTENGGGNQTVSASINVTPREGSYRIATPRASGARLRGTRMKITLNWRNTLATLHAVYTKFRNSARSPF